MRRLVDLSWSFGNISFQNQNISFETQSKPNPLSLPMFYMHTAYYWICLSSTQTAFLTFQVVLTFLVFLLVEHKLLSCSKGYIIVFSSTKICQHFLNSVNWNLSFCCSASEYHCFCLVNIYYYMVDWAFRPSFTWFTNLFWLSFIFINQTVMTKPTVSRQEPRT